MKIKINAALWSAVIATSLSFSARADCTLTNLGLTPLCDLGPGSYLGFQGGLYPGGSNQRPAAHEAAGVAIAQSQVRPRDAAGNVDTNTGKIALLSIGLSNTTQEWATRGNHFTAQATADPSLNPQVAIVDGAQGGQDAVAWANPNGVPWTTLQTRLSTAGITSNQVQAVWLKLVIAGPNSNGGPFPGHAQTLRAKLGEVIAVAKQKLPNLAIVYVSSRTRAYVQSVGGAHPETYAYESGWSVKWLVEDQLNGQLNYNPSNGPVVAPWIAWGPYLWIDGERPRSDELTWLCADVNADFYHPSAIGCDKVGRQLLSFFKTDPTSRPWFLKQTVTGQPPVSAPAASATNGVVPLAVNFTANASDPDGSILSYHWNFDDGTTSTNANPQKTFPVPGAHRVRLTVTDNAGNTTTSEQLITVTAAGAVPPAITTPSPLPAGTNGTPYAQTFSATGGSAPYSWNVTSGALPAGLVLSTNGNLTGTPTTNGSFNFTVQVTDATNATSAAAFALMVSAPPSTAYPWKKYLGANTAAGFGTAPWHSTIRGGYPRGSNRASMNSTVDPALLDTVLAVSDWINLQDGYNYRGQAEVDAFFNAVRADRGAAWRTNCALMAQAMVDGQVRNAATGHKTYWELGNEIYASNPPETIGAWIAANNLPYPHPNSPYNDNPTHAARGNDRGIIGYQVEYQIALALEAILGVNATAPAGHKVRIITPASTGGSINNGSATGWTSTLLNYVIAGYEVEKDAGGNTFTNFSKPLASSLAGRRLGDLVDIVNVHYILGAANGTTLNTVFNTWTGGTNRATGVFHTEEGGINAATGGRGGLSAMNNFARATDVRLTRGLSPADARLVYYASGDGPVGTRGTDALTELHGFIPGDTTVLTRKPGLLTSGALTLETYTLENQDQTKRVLFVLPGNNTTVSFSNATMQAGGWNWTNVTGAARLWNTNANPSNAVTVTRAGDGSRYTITFPSVTFTAQNSQALVIFLTGSGAAQTNFPPQITAQPASLITTQGFTASFSVTATGSEPLAYQWLFNDAPLANKTNATLTLYFVATNQAGDYRFVVTNAFGAVTSSVATLTVWPFVVYPPVIVTQPTNVTLGEGLTASFSVGVDGTAPFAHQWFFSGTPLAGQTLATLSLLGITTNSAGSYWVVVTNRAGSVTSSVATLTITVSPWENLSDGTLGRVMSYQSAAGEIIPAYLRKPAGNGPFPLVLLVHGGGTSSNGTIALGRQMQPPKPQFVAAGFVIFSVDFSAVNPGNAFSTDEWELMPRAIETAQRQSFVDARRVAMVGQSHGGMVTCRAASHLDILCAVPCAPAAIDPIAAWEFTQMGGIVSPSLQNVINQTAANYGVPMATLAANPGAYGYRDVTDDAPTVRYPLFLVSGQNDTSSPTNVMNDYAEALAAAGKYFETYYPSNGPHGFVLSTPLIPESYEFATRAVNFMAKYFSLADTDADGLPDGWELSRFNTLAPGSNDDSDGDGLSNAAEYHAGTHPAQADSGLRISEITREPSGEITLTFPAVAGLTYALEYSTNLTAWQLVPAAALVEPLTGHLRWTDNHTQTGGWTTTRYYRVRRP